MTLAQLEALEERRAIAIRHARFNAALVTSALINAHLPADARPVSPFAFIAGFEPDPVEEERAERRRQIKHGIVVAMSRLPVGTTPEQVQELRGKMLERLKAQGIEDAEGLFREVFPEV